MEGRVARHDGRDDRGLEGAGRGDDEVGLDQTIRGLDAKAVLALLLTDRRHLHAGADGCVDALGVGAEVVGDLILGRERVGVDVELQSGEAVVPCGTVGDQRIPSPRAPAFGYAITLEYEVVDSLCGEMLTHRDTCLARAHDEHLDLCGRGTRGCLRPRRSQLHHLVPPLSRALSLTQ